MYHAGMMNKPFLNPVSYTHLVGFARKPPVFLKPGDVVEIEIDGIGTLRNSVAAEE